MEKNHQRIGIINWLALLAVACLSVALARFGSTAAGLTAAALLGFGFLVAAVSYFQLRLEDQERLEGLEFQELKKAKGESTLFAGEDSFSAKRSRQQFERFLVPAFTILLFGLQITAIVLFWKWLPTAPKPSPNQASVAMALFALFALVLFLLGKYASAIARLEHQPLLRPGAGYLMIGSVACFVVAAAEAATWFRVPQADLYVARAFVVLLGLVAAETLINLVMEVYRPRLPGQRARLIYESRLIGLFGQPAGLITTAAQALDYQFGFKVSETWVYKFLEKALSWIILLQLGALFFSTIFVIVEPYESALLERFGRPVPGREVLQPGLHLKWPWPIDMAYRYPTRHLQNFIVGVIPDEDLAAEQVVLWTRPHYKEEFNLLVASREAPAATNDDDATEKPVPANLLAASIPVYYEVTNLVHWTYHAQATGQLLEDLANREVIRYLINVDFDSVMSTDRAAAGEALHQRIQAQADRYELGVRIVYIGLENIHPPIGTKQVPIAASFEQVVGAMQQRETNILAALAYQAGKIPLAQAEATNLIIQARSERASKVANAAAEADLFRQQSAADRTAPSAYRPRFYLESLARALGPVPKYVVAATNTHDVLILNLQERIRSDLASGVILPPDATRPAQP